MLRVFKIVVTDGNPDGRDLIGLLIEKTDDGYYLVAPGAPLEPPKVLAHTHTHQLQLGKKKKFSFKFGYRGKKWTLDVDHTSELELDGTWGIGEVISEEEDTWVATGGGAGAPEDDEAFAAHGS